jgi:hypothetical protein
VDYLKQCLRTGQKAAQHYGWQVIDFQRQGRERDVQEKNDEIFAHIQKAGLV